MKIKLSVNGENVYLGGKNITRLVNRAKKIDWSKHPTVFLSINYGLHKDNFGSLIGFGNTGTYTDKDTFWIALGAFVEDYRKPTVHTTNAIRRVTTRKIGHSLRT